MDQEGASGSWRDWSLGPAPGGIHFCMHGVTKLQAGLASKPHHKVWDPVTVEAIGLWRLGPATGGILRQGQSP